MVESMSLRRISEGGHDQAVDMEVFLGGVLAGSYATRQRHLRQAKIMQTRITERWQRPTPWSWKKKHVTWFLERSISQRSEMTRYYYTLTARLIAERMEAPWTFWV
jgi:hypothetical protein